MREDNTRVPPIRFTALRLRDEASYKMKGFDCAARPPATRRLVRVYVHLLVQICTHTLKSMSSVLRGALHANMKIALLIFL